jgi:hypothetical protein
MLVFLKLFLEKYFSMLKKKFINYVKNYIFQKIILILLILQIYNKSYDKFNSDIIYFGEVQKVNISGVSLENLDQFLEKILPSKQNINKIKNHFIKFNLCYIFLLVYFLIASYFEQKAEKIINNDFYIFFDQVKEKNVYLYLSKIKNDFNFDFIVKMKKQKNQVTSLFFYRYILIFFACIPFFHKNLKKICLTIRNLYDNMNILNSYILESN